MQNTGEVERYAVTPSNPYAVHLHFDVCERIHKGFRERPQFVNRIVRVGVDADLIVPFGGKNGCI